MARVAGRNEATVALRGKDPIPCVYSLGHRAALRYLIDDLSIAESDVELAIMDGDQSESTASLHRMLRRRLFVPL